MKLDDLLYMYVRWKWCKLVKYIYIVGWVKVVKQVVLKMIYIYRIWSFIPVLVLSNRIYSLIRNGHSTLRYIRRDKNRPSVSFIVLTWISWTIFDRLVHSQRPVCTRRVHFHVDRSFLSKSHINTFRLLNEVIALIRFQFFISIHIHPE